jgi:hypothetical protein
MRSIPYIINRELLDELGDRVKTLRAQNKRNPRYALGMALAKVLDELDAMGESL